MSQKFASMKVFRPSRAKGLWCELFEKSPQRQISTASASCRQCTIDTRLSRSRIPSFYHQQALLACHSLSLSRRNVSTDTVSSTKTPSTHYDMFPSTLGSSAIPPSGPFGIDLRPLKREFLQLQAKAHPDMMPSNLKRQAEGLSARINEAYKTLQDPLLRAQYLLSLKGIDVAGDETAKIEDQELLMEVLETQEVIQDAEKEADLHELNTANQERIRQSIDELKRAFEADNMDSAKTHSIRLRYWVNIQNSIQAWEPGKPVVMIH